MWLKFTCSILFFVLACLSVRAQDMASGDEVNGLRKQRQIQRLQALQALLVRDEVSNMESEIQGLDFIDVKESKFKIYFDETKVIYLNRQCSDKESTTPFFLNYYPLQRTALAKSYQKDGYIKLNAKLKSSFRSFEYEGQRLCWTMADLPPMEPYFLYGGQMQPGGEKLWSFGKKFVSEETYLNNNPAGYQDALPEGSVFCYDALAQCYRNRKPALYVGKLVGDGPVDSSGAVVSNDFYVLSERPANQIEQNYPGRLVEDIGKPQSKIADIINQYGEVTVIVTVRGDAAKELGKENIRALSKLGLNLGALRVGGSYAALIEKGALVVEKTNNRGPVEIDGRAYGLEGVSKITSAGGAFGDQAEIIISSKNRSLNRRGMNVAALKRGFLIKRYNFDTSGQDYLIHFYHVKPRVFKRFWYMKDVPESESYSFFVAGHTYGKPRTSLSIDGLYPPFRDMLPRLRGENDVTFGILLGDVVNHASVDSWTKIKSQLSDIRKPVFIVPGNHDVGIGADESYKRKLFENLFGPTYYAFMYSGDLFIVLDGSLDGWNIYGAQLDFLKDTLRQHSDEAANIFIFSHQVLWWTPAPQSLSPAEKTTDRIIPNSWAGWSESTNFWNDVFPLISSLDNPVTFFAGDVGAFPNGSEIYVQHYKNASFVMTGMGGGKRDNFVIVRKMNGKIDFDLIALNGAVTSLGSLEDHEIPPVVSGR